MLEKLKYRDRVLMERNVIYAFIFFMLCVTFVSSYMVYEPHTESPLRWGMEFPTIAHRIEPASAPHKKLDAADAFARFSDFEDTTDEEKVQHWEKDYIYRRSKHNQELRAKLADIIIKYAPHDAVLLDIGAHVGDTGGIILETLRAVGRKDIHLVAVDPDNSKCRWMTRLREDFVNQYDDPEFRTHFHIVNRGIWSHKSRANIFRKYHGGAWTIEEDPWAGDIPLVGLADIVKSDANLFMWHLDVEGTEMKAIEGMLKTNHRPIMIVEAIPGVGKDRMAPINALKAAGYRTVDRLPPNRDYLMFPPSMSDVVWNF